MPLKWREVIEKDEYKTLPDADKAKAKLEYFYDVVAPQVRASIETSDEMIEKSNIDIWNRPIIKNDDGSVSTELSFSIGTDKGEVLLPSIINGEKVTEEEALNYFKQTKEHLGVFKNAESANKYAEKIHDRENIIRDVRSEFLQDASRIEIDRDKPSFIKEVVGETIAKFPKRAAGMALGAVLASPSMGMSGFKLVNEAREKKQPMPSPLEILGHMPIEGIKTVFKEGYLGSSYKDFHKYMFGKTVKDSMVEGFTKINVSDPERLANDLSPTIEFLGDMIADPLIVSGMASNLARFKVPKEWIGKIPEKVMSDIKRIDDLEAGQKKVIETLMKGVEEKRLDYVRWWKNEGIPQLEKQAKGTPLLKPQEGIVKSEIPRPLEDFGIKVQAKEEPALSKTIRTTPKISETGRQQGVSPEGIAGMEKINTFRQAKGLPLLKPVPIDELRKAEITKSTQKMNEFRVKKGIEPIKLRASGGALLGFEQDEEGNVYYDIKKGLLGAVGVGAGVKLSKHTLTTTRKAKELLSRNPAIAKVLSGIGQEKQIYTLPEVIQKLNVKLFDRFAILKNASPKTYEAARTFQAYKDQALMKFRPLVDAFKSVKKDNVLITAYVKAHRDLTRAERGFKNPGGVTLDDANQAIKEIETEWVSKGKKLDDLQSTMDAFNQWTHDEILYPMLESGFINKQGYDDIVKNNKWYAAYDVIEHMPENLDNMPILASSEYFSKSNQDIIKSLKGTEKLIDDPIDSTIRKFTSAQAAIAKNKIASTLVDDPNMATLIRSVATSKKEFAIMKNQGLNPFMEGGFNKKEWGQINRFKDGRVERYAMPKEIADSMKQLSTHQAPKLIRAYNSIFRATATTLSPAFLVRNVFRDAILGYISSPYHGATGAPKFAYDWGKGAWEAIKHEFGKPSLVDDYVKAGGSFGWAGSEAFEAGGKEAAKKLLFKQSILKSRWNLIKDAKDLITKANEIVEMAPRLGTFERGMKLGHTLEDAAMAGRQATIDFNRGATWLKVANQYVPFLNARVQAKVTLYDAFKRDWKSTSAKLMSTVMLPGMAGYAWNKLYHPDLYDDIPEQIRQDNFCLVYGEGQDPDTGNIVPKYIAIPKGDAGTLFNPFEFALESKFNEDPKSTKEFLVNFLSDISPVEFAQEGELSHEKAGGSLVPPLAKPFLEDWANLKFYQGTEIVPYWMEKTKPPELQYKEATPEFYKWLGQKTKISPLRLQNYASNFVTTYGRVGFSPQAMADVIKGSLLKEQGGEHESEAFKQIKSIEQGYNTIRAYAEEAVNNGDGSGANILINEWNSGINELIGKYNDRFGKYGLNDQGGLRKSYFITREKRRNILLKKESILNPLEKRLSR